MHHAPYNRLRTKKKAYMKKTYLTPRTTTSLLSMQAIVCMSDANWNYGYADGFDIDNNYDEME